MSRAALLSLCGLAAAGPAGVPQPPDYEQWTAADKAAWFDGHLDVGTGGSSHPANFYDRNEYPSTYRYCMVDECIYPGGFETHKDVVEPYKCRSRGIHPQGIVAWVKAVWLPNDYTGMFQKAEYGFARWGYQMLTDAMSKQIKAANEWASGKTFKPMEEGMAWDTADCNVYDCFNLSKGYRYNASLLEVGERPDSPEFMALKFFRDGVPSASIHTGLQDWPSWNHFDGVYTNLQINLDSEPNDTTSGSMSIQGAQRGTLWPGFTGLHDMAMYDQEGQLQHRIRFPYQLLFENVTQDVVPASAHGWYHESVPRMAKLEPGTTLFEIYAKDTFAAPKVLIGRLELASKIMMSADTDRQVFFSHPRYDRDIVLRPEFTMFGGCKTWWLCPICPLIPMACSPSLEEVMRWELMQSAALAGDTQDAVGKRSKISNLSKLSKLAKHRLDGLPRWSCSGRAQAATAAPERPEPSPNATGASTFLQKSVVVRRSKGRRRQQWLEPQGMREDDLPVDPLSGLQYPSDRFCTKDPNAWPITQQRPGPWTSSCEAAPVLERYPSEPEYALAADCEDIPQCSKFDGTWYSLTYPCKCGENTCVSGQLCTSATSSCVSWGPYADWPES